MIVIRAETPEDAEAIGILTSAAFAEAPHSAGTEAAIVAALRAAGALTLSLVAIDGEAIVGHVAFSPVRIEGGSRHWFGIGPVSVRPDRQGSGIGSALIRDGLRQMKESGAAGCVLVGDPAYYSRFGFLHDPDLHVANVPPPYLQRLPFTDVIPKGEVRFHAGFEAS